MAQIRCRRAREEAAESKLGELLVTSRLSCAIETAAAATLGKRSRGGGGPEKGASSDLMEAAASSGADQKAAAALGRMNPQGGSGDIDL